MRSVAWNGARGGDPRFFFLFSLEDFWWMRRCWGRSASRVDQEMLTLIVVSVAIRGEGFRVCVDG